MQKYFLILLFILFSSCTAQQFDNKITFILISTNITAGDSIYISGSDSLLGNWNPGLINLERINDSTWMKEIIFPKNTIIEFKFTKGSWSSEALANDGSIPENHTLKIVSDTTLNFNVMKWKQNETITYNGQITGTVKYHNNLQANDLKPRDIIVWLPPGYSKENTKRYPVLYMHDGQNIIDPVTSAFGNDWQVDEVADSLIQSNTINEMIIVGIYNTSDRTAEYSYTPSGYKYMDFIVSNLKPFIDKEYRTLPDRNNTAVAGSSMGGLISFMMVWNYPHIFSKAACFSPAFKINEFNFVDSVQDYNSTKKELMLYIDNGEVGSENYLLPGVKEMISALQDKGYKSDEDLKFFIDPNGIHSETSWAHRVWRPLIFFFGKN